MMRRDLAFPVICAALAVVVAAAADETTAPDRAERLARLRGEIE
jgi:hypothetical protein